MGFAFLRRFTALASNSLSLQRTQLSSLKAWAFLGGNREYSTTDRLQLSPLFPRTDVCDAKDCEIESVDDDTWHLSSGLAFDALKRDHRNNAWKASWGFSHQDDDGVGLLDVVDSSAEEPDFDVIEDMRFRRNLFYKLDKDSKEYEEYSFDFHRRNTSRNEKEQKNTKKENHPCRELVSKKTINSSLGQDKNGHSVIRLRESKDSRNKERSINKTPDPYDDAKKKQRTPTFNQLTAPYHEPFCLDIYVSKGSVRASIIHRATSKVVAVAHSISKDMKYDLGSTKNRNACAAVGEVLARRALADDIHNAVYTPRKGDKLEGKLQIVLKAIVNSGVDVKVKLKQKNSRRAKP